MYGAAPQRGSFPSWALSARTPVAYYSYPVPGNGYHNDSGDFHVLRGVRANEFPHMHRATPPTPGYVTPPPCSRRSTC
jgi:hypothetical protein